MATLDVSDVLDGADLNDFLTVIRTTQTVGTNGRTITATQQFAIQGVVQPGSGDDLVQLPEGTRSKDVLVVYTRFPLQAPTDEAEADQVIWNGVNWRSNEVEPWDNYGSGYMKALLVRIPLG